MKEEEKKQEIEWLRDEISQDECVMNSKDASEFHANRLAENRVKLKNLLGD